MALHNPKQGIPGHMPDVRVPLPLPAPGSLLDHIYGTIYGNCIGDAIGLLTEFLTKGEAHEVYAKYLPDLEYKYKMMDSHRSRWKNGDWTDDSDQMILILQSLLHNDGKVYAKYLPDLEYKYKMMDSHRSRWKNGDWTDDSDQMILILQSLLHNDGKVVPADFGRRLKVWAHEGFPELGDYGGMGIGSMTKRVLRNEAYDDNPHKAARDIWESTGRNVAPNGAVMRTSILGILSYQNIGDVIKNTLDMCKATHFDPRCQASCVSVTTAIALMLQNVGKKISVDEIIKDSSHLAEKLVRTNQKEELRKYLNVEELSELCLDEHGKIGYTYKTLGSGFWALKQTDFRKALTDIVMEAGDADTNGAIAGALLGCKLGIHGLPKSWLEGLVHRRWLDENIYRFLSLMGIEGLPDANWLDPTIPTLDHEHDLGGSDARVHRGTHPHSQESEKDHGSSHTRAHEGKYSHTTQDYEQIHGKDPEKDY